MGGVMSRSIALVIVFLSALVARANQDAQIETVYGEPRKALIIGNSAYPNGPLRNPTNDAADVARLLKQRSFDVILLTNATKEKMESAITAFGEQLANGGVGLFYYAGHAMQVKGTNYLMPVDANPAREVDVRHHAVDVELVLTELDVSANRLNLIVLDACRDNPFTRSFRSSARGLVRMRPPRGTLIAYATSPEKAAADGEGRNGVYTMHLLEQMRVPGQEMQTMFKKVRAAVAEVTKGAQTTEEWDRVTGDFYFTPIDLPDQDFALTTDELTRYRLLLAEQQAADALIRQEEAKNVAALAAMEQEIEQLRIQIREPGQVDNSLDQLVQLVERREKYQVQLVAARTKAEGERLEREAEISRLHTAEISKRRIRFENDYEKYRRIADSDLMQDEEKTLAWRLICSNWGIVDAETEPVELYWDNETGTVTKYGPTTLRDGPVTLRGRHVMILFAPFRKADAKKARVLLEAMSIRVTMKEIRGGTPGTLNYGNQKYVQIAAIIAHALLRIEQLSPHLVTLTSDCDFELSLF
jgi:uncharacterized caspase-like protein